MGKADPGASKATRKRQLNVIYFIDSARTRTISISLGQLKLLACAGCGVVVWSISSVALVAWLLQGQVDLVRRLHGALSAIFEYETRDDKVFDIAYPPAVKTVEPALVRNEIPVKGLMPTPHSGAAAAPAAIASQVVSDEDLDQIGGDQDETGPVPKVSPLVPTKHTAMVDKAVADGAVQIGHPRVEMQPTKLDLRFDLTSKASSGLVEGYIYAVAEFTTDQGEHVYIGAPGEIQVSAKGEPGAPMKAASFAIRRFKQKHFSFPIVKGKDGMFTKVHIAVLDRSGGNRSAIDLPVQFRIGKVDSGESHGDAAPAPKPG